MTARVTRCSHSECPQKLYLHVALANDGKLTTVRGAQPALQQLLYSPSLLSAWLSLIPAEASDEGLANRQASRAHERLGQRAAQFSARLVELAIAIRGPEQSMMDVAARGCDLDQAAGCAMGPSPWCEGPLVRRWGFALLCPRAWTGSQ